MRKKKILVSAVSTAGEPKSSVLLDNCEYVFEKIICWAVHKYLANLSVGHVFSKVVV